MKFNEVGMIWCLIRIMREIFARVSGKVTLGNIINITAVHTCPDAVCKTF